MQVNDKTRKPIEGYFILKQFDKNGDISLIYTKNYGSILVVNNNMLNSTYIRLFVLENYDKNLF